MEKELNKLIKHPHFKSAIRSLQRIFSTYSEADLEAELEVQLYFYLLERGIEDLDAKVVIERATRKVKDTLFYENGYKQRSKQDIESTKMEVESTYVVNDVLITEIETIQTNSMRYKKDNVVSLNALIADSEKSYEDLLLNEEAISIDAQYQLELEETAIENITYLQSVLKSKSLAIFNLFLEGLDTQEIADALEIKEDSVKRALKRILEKLEDKNKEEAVEVVEAEEVVETQSAKLVIIYEVKKEDTHSDIKLTSNFMKNARAFRQACSTNQLPTPSKVKNLLRNKNNIEKSAEKGFEYLYYKYKDKIKLLKKGVM